MWMIIRGTIVPIKDCSYKGEHPKSRDTSALAISVANMGGLSNSSRVFGGYCSKILKGQQGSNTSSNYFDPLLFPYL